VDKVAITIGVLLILLGLGGFAGSETHAPTALIPAYIGAVLALLGVVVAAKPAARKHAMHAAAAISLLGGAMAAWRLVKALSAGTATNLQLVSFVGTTALCFLFVILAVRSFIAARKAREAGAA
jgi:hypothetical protein